MKVKSKYLIFEIKANSNDYSVDTRHGRSCHSWPLQSFFTESVPHFALHNTMLAHSTKPLSVGFSIFVQIRLSLLQNAAAYVVSHSAV